MQYNDIFFICKRLESISCLRLMRRQDGETGCTVTMKTGLGRAQASDLKEILLWSAASAIIRFPMRVVGKALESDGWTSRFNLEQLIHETESIHVVMRDLDF